MSLFSSKKKAPTTTKTPLAEAKQVSKLSPKPTAPAMPSRPGSPKAGFGTLSPSAGTAPTKTGGPIRRPVSATRKPQTAKPKAADPTAKSYTDDIYAKYEGQQAKMAATKTPKKAAKASYR